MQILPGIIQILNGSGSWAGSNGEHGETPRITLALAARLLIDLRGAERLTPETADLAPYPYAEFADCVSWYIAIDSDYDQLTMPPIKRSTGISIAQDENGKTILAADLPILDSPEIRATVKTAGEIPLKGEIGALDAEGNSVFVFDFPIILKNRVYIPGGGGDTPTPSDPEFLNTDQVQAFVISKLAEAIAELELPEGDPGPAPTLSIGTVTVDATAAATLTPTGNGAYAINLVLPRATDGSTPEPITPQIAIGTIQAGTEAAASLVPVVGTPGAFTLNLTLPRGADGSGVSPAGTWATDVTYSLNAAVRHASAWWRSLHDDNLGNEPPATRVDNAHWQIIVKDGVSADPLIVNYNDTDDPDDDGWHLYRIATDRYYRFTTDGGLTFTEAMEISQAPLNVLILFNPDATTDWQDVPAPVGTNNYHIATGKYYRVKTDAGIWGTPQQIHALDATEIFRVQYGATPENEEDEPEWHANFQPGDDRILFYNTLGSIRLDIAVTLADGEEIGGVQLCSISNPWHASYAATDLYKKISVDSGLTWTVPILLSGKSAYQEWLDLGNSGTPEDFLASLKGEPGNGEGGTTTPLSSSNPLGLGLASAGVATSAARADHVHPVTGLVLASEKGAVLGVASLGLDGKVPLSQLPAMSGGTALPITRQRFARPYFDAATHLVIQAGQALDFSDVVTIIDTANVAADRAKVIGYTGLVLTPCPDTGFGGNFSGQPVFVDLSVLATAAILRYKWVAADGDSDWYVTFFPSNGEAYVAPPASSSGETPAPTTFGTLKVNISGAMTGQWSADGGSTWHDSGDTITVATGTHTVTFAFVDGYTTPASQSVTISENTLSTVSAEYYEIEEPTETEGTLVVNITGAAGGRWSVDGGTTWKSGGQSLLLTAGSYTITFEPILGYSKPDDISATIVAGNITVKSGAYVAQPDSADPTDYGMTWDNGTEPILGEGKKVIYVTPNGAGNFSGDSWANAKAGLYTAGLAAVSGDVLYVQEGTYTSHLATVAATKSIGIYGGFTVADGTWATRNGFDYPTVIDAGSNPSVPFIRPESGVTQAVDGISCTGFTGGVMLANGGSATVRNCAIYDCGGTVSSHAVDNCLILDCTGGTGAATDCVFVKVDTSGSITGGNATDCIFLNCSAGNVVWGTATGCALENCEASSQYGCVKENAEDCTFTNCSYSVIVSGGATNCTFTNCSSSYIVSGGATNCTFTNCSSSNSNNSVIVSGGATNCTFTNCSSSSYSSYSAIVSGSATNCTFTNCSSSSNNSCIVYGGATNCTFVRCVAVRLRYHQGVNDITNCVIFGCTITTIDFGAGTNNAAPAYIDANTLVLGTNNTLAKFASLGTVETIGYSETLNNTPAEDFGDFRPMVGSVLIGAGVAVSGITDDIEGNLRPDPPTIGAYEYVEEA